MKINKHSMNHKLMAAATLSCALFQTSCKLPTREVLQGFQREGIVGYFAKNQLERDVAVSEIAPEAPENSRPITTSLSPADEHAPFVSPGGNRQLAESVNGRPGFVYSPYSSARLLVDVTEFAPGSQVLCPYTNQPFIVPSRGSSSVATVVTRERPMNKPIYPNMEERTSSAPPVKRSPPPVSKPPVKTQSMPKTSTPSPAPKKTAADDNGAIPYAKRIEGRPDYVYSPYATKSQIVDVSGMAAGAKVRCPYTGKLFLVPAGGTPAPAPKTETPNEEITPKPAPTPAPTPKPEPKKEAPVKTEPKPEPIKENPKPEPKKEDPKKEDPKPEPKKEEPKKEEPKKDEGIKEGGSAAGGTTPSAKWADGKDGYVVSPYGNFLVDVRGKEGGSQMRCPFSGKLFTVPSK